MRSATEKQGKAKRAWTHVSAAHQKNISNYTISYTNLVPKFVSTAATPNLNQPYLYEFMIYCKIEAFRVKIS